MIVDMTTGCCNCCDPGMWLCGCLPAREVCFEFSGGSPGLFSVPVGHAVPVNRQGYGYGPGQGMVTIHTRYEDPVTGLRICLNYQIYIFAECNPSGTVDWFLLAPIDNAPAYNNALVIQPGGSGTCMELFLNTKGSAVSPFSAFGEIVPLGTTPFPPDCGSIGPQTFEADVTIPSVPSFVSGGIGDVTTAIPLHLNLTLDLNCAFTPEDYPNTTQADEYSGVAGLWTTALVSEDYNEGGFCCLGPFDGGDVPGPNPGPPVVPPDRVLTPCCAVEGQTVSKVLTVITDTLGVCPALEFTIGVTYQNAQHAWIGTTISGGQFITVIVWCNAPASDEWFMRIYCGGILIWGASGAQFTGDSCPVDMEAGPNTSDTSPCCASGVPLIARVFDPTI